MKLHSLPDGNDWITVESYSQNVESNPLVTLVEYQNYQYPDVELGWQY